MFFNNKKRQMNKEYGGKKEERAEKARHHTAYMDANHSQEIHDCIVTSKCYFETFQSPNVNRSKTKIPSIELKATDTVSALFDILDFQHVTGIDVGRIALLNFASFKNPGGKFIEGSSAQEESLCHSSFLYNVLRHFDETIYARNRRNTNRGLYFNRAIYTPNILFFNPNPLIRSYYHTSNADVITCAAPNRSIGKNRRPGEANYGDIPSENENYKALYERCQFVLKVAQDNDVKTLVLGAFGCGVFAQNPYVVARIFTSLLSLADYSFDRVIFAVPNTGHSKDNYDAFYRAFTEFRIM